MEIGSAVLTFQDRGQRVERSGRLLNVSADGVLLRLREEIALHTQVRMRLSLTEEEALVTGEVVHCTPTVGAFKVGVQLMFDEQGA